MRLVWQRKTGRRERRLVSAHVGEEDEEVRFDSQTAYSMNGVGQCIFRKLTKFKILANIFLFIGCLITILQLVAESGNLADKTSKYSSDIKLSTQPVGYDRDQTCQFPVLNPFDPSILQYVKHPYPIFCQRVQPELTYAEGHFMKIDLALAQRHRFKNVYYRIIVRKNETHINYGNWTHWNITTTSHIYLYESVEVFGQYVFDKRDTKIPPKRYRNLHASVHIENETDRSHQSIIKNQIRSQESIIDNQNRLRDSKIDYQNRVNNSQIDNRSITDQSNNAKIDNMSNFSPPLNVLIFGIDSLSRSNFIRNLPKTYKFLTDQMKSIVFRGYTKIDDNTFPNILAVLTGHKVTIHGSELEGHFQHDYVDHYPFIWKNFSEQGYATGLAEEQPGVLSYKAKGFDQSPVDWYLRPFGVALDKSPLRKYSSPSCIGNRPEAKIILDSINRFLITKHDSRIPYFLFSFLWKLSHDKTYDVEVIDHLIADFFRNLYEKGYFNNTLIFVMSDHGNRFDTIRRTLIGRYEERMPYLSLFVPPWFRQRYPLALENLQTNVWRLTCQYDVFETLVDILNKDYNNEQRPRFKNRGHSLFNSIPKSRTCEDAHISAHFCVCQKEENLPVENPNVISAAKYALEIINTKFLGQQSTRTLCSKLRLKNILTAQKYKASDNVRYGIRWHYNKLLLEKNVTSVVSNLRVTFNTSPNEGVYEALVQYYDTADAKLDASFFNATNAEISRINEYGHDGDCVSKIDRNLEKFCYCRTGWLF